MMPAERSVILLLPGMTLNATIFPSFGLPTIAVDFTTLVLGPDGSSPELLSRRMALYADLLDQRLAAESSWRGGKRIVVAHSFGGMLALAWWLGHRGAGHARIDGLVLAATTAGPMFDRARVRVRLGPFRTRIGLARVMPIWNRPAVTRAAKRWFSGRQQFIEPVDFRRLPNRSDWAIDCAGWRNTDWRSMRSYRLALEGFDVRGELGKIDVPAIVLHGAEDTLFGLDVARELAAGLPRAELRVIPGAGHGLPLTHGEELVRAVEDVSGGA